jgi:membrane associated rhomboid family serine protease
MTRPIPLSTNLALAWAASAGRPLAKKFWFHFELGTMVLILLLLNGSLLHGECNARLIFLPAAVRNGEWWRVLTHPFIHVTWFHLLLDATAFFLLYQELQEQVWPKRHS